MNATVAVEPELNIAEDFDADHSESPSISWPACRRPAPRALLGAARRTRRRGAAGDDHDPAGARSRASASRLMYVAEDLLRAEGFAEVRIRADRRHGTRWRHGSAVKSTSASIFAAPLVYHLDAGRADHGRSAGVHTGCFELFAHERDPARCSTSRAGASASRRLGSSPHVFLAVIADLRRPRPGAMTSTGSRAATGPPKELFAAGKIDAFLGFPPEPQELRARKHRPRDPERRGRPAVVGVLLLSAGGQPRNSSGKHPIATKRVLRAILKADRPVRRRAGARSPGVLVDGGFTAALRLRAPDAERSAVRHAGASTIRRTPCASTRCACTRRA